MGKAKTAIDTSGAPSDAASNVTPIDRVDGRVLVRGTLIACLLLSTAGTSASADEPFPAALATPVGSVPSGRYQADGDQIYICVAKDGVTAWALKAPEASLADADGKAFIHHFAGPTWQAADGSKVVGTLIAKIAAPTPGAIPWLLLRATATGTGALGGIRFVQRLNTKGGVAPLGRCTYSAELRVPYTATYAFWR